MNVQAHDDPKLVAAAERRMQAWVHNQEITDRSASGQAPVRPGVRIGPYVAISRDEGAGASEIAAEVGRLLGWEVLDKNFLDQMAVRSHLSKSMLELVDETSGNWAFDVLGAWLDPAIIPHEKYIAHLVRAVMAAGRRGKVVIVGRGASFILPRHSGLSVRIVASRQFRVHCIMQERRLSEGNAQRFIETSDRERRDFVHRYFHSNIDDPLRYDLMLDVEHINPLRAAETIVHAARVECED